MSHQRWYELGLLGWVERRSKVAANVPTSSPHLASDCGIVAHLSTLLVKLGCNVGGSNRPRALAARVARWRPAILAAALCRFDAKLMSKVSRDPGWGALRHCAEDGVWGTESHRGEHDPGSLERDRKNIEVILELVHDSVENSDLISLRKQAEITLQALSHCSSLVNWLPDLQSEGKHRTHALNREHFIDLATAVAYLPDLDRDFEHPDAAPLGLVLIDRLQRRHDLSRHLRLDRASAKDSWLVTLGGPVGIGKTTLARSVLTSKLDLIVDLSIKARAGLTTFTGEFRDNPVAVRVAQELGIGGNELLPSRLVDRLAKCRVVCLDNCDGLIYACQEYVHQIDRLSNRRYRILLTSRQWLEASVPETQFEVEPLSDKEAWELFEVRYLSKFNRTQTEPGRIPDLATQEARRELLRRWQGIPLRVEATASNMDHASTLCEILESLNEAPISRFTLRGLSDYAPFRDEASSWESRSLRLLNEEQMKFLRLVSHYSGPISTQSMAEVLDLPHRKVVTLAGELVCRSIARRLDDLHFQIYEGARECALYG